MPPTSRQLVFAMDPPPAFGDDDFLVAPCNDAAYATLAHWPEWPDPAVLLVGPRGAGKSHLAAIWAARAAAHQLTRDDIRRSAWPREMTPILVDDADAIDDESGLFHLLNLVGERRSTVLLTASRAPEAWPVRLPDLLSRLRRATRVELDAPDDDLIRAVIVKLLVERQLHVEEGVVEFIARHIDRSLDTVRTVVARLDAEALSRGCRISRGLAADVLRASKEGREDHDDR